MLALNLKIRKREGVNFDLLLLESNKRSSYRLDCIV